MGIKQLASWLSPGTKLRVSYNHDDYDDSRNFSLEVRGMVDDQVIYRAETEDAYKYHMVSVAMFEVWLEKGRLSKL